MRRLQPEDHRHGAQPIAGLREHDIDKLSQLKMARVEAEGGITVIRQPDEGDEDGVAHRPASGVR